MGGEGQGHARAMSLADWLLVLAKCTVPAFFVAASGTVAIPVNKALGDGEGAEFFRKARSHHVWPRAAPFHKSKY